MITLTDGGFVYGELKEDEFEQLEKADIAYRCGEVLADCPFQTSDASEIEHCPQAHLTADFYEEFGPEAKSILARLSLLLQREVAPTDLAFE